MGIIPGTIWELKPGPPVSNLALHRLDPPGRHIYLDMNVFSFCSFSATRFRWQQDPVDSPSVSGHEWAIRDVYIGPSCLDHCSGHGYCEYPRCVCDEGYEGSNCHLLEGTIRPVSTLRKFIKLSMSQMYNFIKWVSYV